MLKIPSKVSVMISLALSVLFFIVLIAGAVIMPTQANIFIDLIHKVETQSARIFIIVLAYLILLIMALADVFLFRLLKLVKEGKVFTVKSVAYIRCISWCAMILCPVFALLGIYFYISFFVSFACIFFGISLRVVKNVIEEATRIKAENDFTI
ncbi:MAG: DUF2975 domain-containing protein [Ruminococcaceae bacterium]|nr:DUF2975 domain-containing protein [Oscillospiraceae bacterium]